VARNWRELHKHFMDTRKPEKEEVKQEQPIYNRPGSGLHNDYKIRGDEEKKDEKESFEDYNGNGSEVVKEEE
jgi:hypothetical protein